MADLRRCAWAETDPLLREYHDHEYGLRPTTDATTVVTVPTTSATTMVRGSLAALPC